MCIYRLFGAPAEWLLWFRDYSSKRWWSAFSLKCFNFKCQISVPRTAVTVHINSRFTVVHLGVEAWLQPWICSYHIGKPVWWHHCHVLKEEFRYFQTYQMIWSRSDHRISSDCHSYIQWKCLFLPLTGWGCFSECLTTLLKWFPQRETFLVNNRILFYKKHKPCSRRPCSRRSKSREVSCYSYCLIKVVKISNHFVNKNHAGSLSTLSPNSYPAPVSTTIFLQQLTLQKFTKRLRLERDFCSQLLFYKKLYFQKNLFC